MGEAVLVLIINGTEIAIDLSQIGLTMESSNNDILEASSGQLQEMGQPVSNLSSLYKVHKAFDSNRIFVIPNSTAGN
jgi:hypothetical protein